MDDSHPLAVLAERALRATPKGMRAHLTHVGTATVLIELPGLTLLTDPVLGGPCTCHFGFGMRSRHLRGPYVARASLPPIDVALVSHDQHEDNLDVEGRAVLRGAREVITTRAAAGRLGRPAIGLADFETHVVRGEGLEVRVTATPARHGPPLSLPFVGPVIGFLLEWEGQSHGALYVSGDTVYFGGIEEIARRHRVGTALLHLGRAGYLGAAFTMDAAAGARAAKTLGARTVVPIHYDDWTHFTEAHTRIEPAFAAAGLADRLRRLPKGERVAIEL